VLAELDDAAFVEEFLFHIGALILKRDAHAPCSEMQFAQASDQDVVGELGHGEDLRVGQKWTLCRACGSCRSPSLGGPWPHMNSSDDKRCRRCALDLKVDGQRVYNRNPHAVQTAGYLYELSSNFPPACNLVITLQAPGCFPSCACRRVCPAVVDHGYAVVRVNDDVYQVTKTCHGFIDAVVHTSYTSGANGDVDVADVHGRSFTDRLEAFQNLDIVCGVVGISVGIHKSTISVNFHFKSAWHDDAK